MTSSMLAMVAETILAQALILFATSMRWNSRMWKMSRIVVSLGVMLTVWPTSCTMVFVRGLRLEVKVVLGKIIREFRMPSSRDIVEHAG